MKRFALSTLLLNVSLLALLPFCKANQADKLEELILSKWSQNPPITASWPDADELKSEDYSSVYVASQNGLMQADKIWALPGQPSGVNFDQYSGYVTIDPVAGRALFYYFVESPHSTSAKPLVLWLNGGPGCSSLGFGAFEELGPFRVNSDGKTLFHNKYAWNNVANVLFLESPAGVGFSYSNTSSDYNNLGDRITANDAYVFLINWLERFPQYKSRDFLIAGESYAGHYVPQLAYTILLYNKFTNHTTINLKGIAIGNALIDDIAYSKGTCDYLWTHALISDESYGAIYKSCFDVANFTEECIIYATNGSLEIGEIDPYNIYAPICHNTSLGSGSSGSVFDFDPCSDNHVEAYLNDPEVQKALHAKPTNWSLCSGVHWVESPETILPVIKYLIDSGIKLLIYSGDTDSVVPVTSSRYAINTLKLPIQVAWYPWYSGNEVGGYVVEYKGLTFVTVRGAGHTVPSWQPARALTMIASFLDGKLPPKTPTPSF